MENRRYIPLWLTILFAALCVCSIIINFVVLPYGAVVGYGGMYALMRILDMLAFAAALLYSLKGYGKNSRVFFKIFVIAYFLSTMASVYGCLRSVNENVLTIIGVVLDMLSFAILFTFMVALDIGKKRSMVLAGILLLFSVLVLLFLLPMASSMLLVYLCRVILAVMFFIMVIAKYRDKAARGRK